MQILLLAAERAMIAGWKIGLIALLSLVAGGQVASANQGKLLAVILKNDAADSSTNPLRARNNATAVSRRLLTLGYAFLQAPEGGSCTTSNQQIAAIDIANAEKALACLGDHTDGVDLVLLYFSGPIWTADNANFLIRTVGDGQPRVPIASLLKDDAAKKPFVSVIIVDAIESSPGSGKAGPYLRVSEPGARRIVAFGAPAGENPEPGLGMTSAYTGRLVRRLDTEIAAQRRGEPLTDLRELLTHPDLVTSGHWQGRTTEVLIEGVGEPITLVGRSSQPSGAAGEKAAMGCESTHRLATRGESCVRLFEFQDNCKRDHHAALAATALRLRCPEELLERKQRAMQQAFAKAEQTRTCAAMTSFLEQHEADYDLADAKEIETATGLKTQLCEQEAREKEIAALEVSLRAVLGENDCAALKSFDRASGRRLSSQQSDRLGDATKQRCDLEEKATAGLQQCLESNESKGNFCGGAACLQTFKSTLPGAKYAAPHEPARERWEKICKAFTDMQSCFSANECSGERCSLPLRLAVSSNLIRFVERSEGDAKRRCEAKLERERLAALERERERERRLQEIRAQLRAAATFSLTLCNHATVGQIWVALTYYDYDLSDWVKEGWWVIAQGSCQEMGNRFRRGALYLYANSAQERYVWKGDFGLCIGSSKFRIVGNEKVSCPNQRHRKFRQVHVVDSSYTYNFND